MQERKPEITEDGTKPTAAAVFFAEPRAKKRAPMQTLPMITAVRASQRCVSKGLPS
jgi:hypothetical protein